MDLISRLSVPADPTWTMARIAALLIPYYEKETPQGIRMIEAEDWAAALEGYPMWAIEKAARWWKDENPARHKRPLEGDIKDRIRVEMGPVNAARVTLGLARPAGRKAMSGVLRRALA